MLNIETLRNHIISSSIQHNYRNMHAVYRIYNSHIIFLLFYNLISVINVWGFIIFNI